MRRGTTPTIMLTVNGLSGITVEKLYLTIKQRGRVVEKTYDDVEISGDVLQAELTQEETLAFMAGADAEIQLRVLSQANVAYASDIVCLPVGEILKDGEI